MLGWLSFFNPTSNCFSIFSCFFQIFIIRDRYWVLISVCLSSVSARCSCRCFWINMFLIYKTAFCTSANSSAPSNSTCNFLYCRKLALHDWYTEQLDLPIWIFAASVALCIADVVPAGSTAPTFSFTISAMFNLVRTWNKHRCRGSPHPDFHALCWLIDLLYRWYSHLLPWLFVKR